MKHVNLDEYRVAKNDVIYGVEFKEYPKLNEDGSIFKRYDTEKNGSFYELNTNGRIEFWSDKYPDIRIYDEEIPTKEVTMLGTVAKQIGNNEYCIELINGKVINISKDVENAGEWKIDNQYFSNYEWAKKYLKELMYEKITGMRIIPKKGNIPDICGVNGISCRHPNDCNAMLCSGCPIANKYFAERDGVTLVYAVNK